MYMKDWYSQKEINKECERNTRFIILKKKPSIDFQDYYSRKRYYRIEPLFLCETDERILYYLTGWPRCSHETLLWDNSTSWNNTLTEEEVKPALSLPGCLCKKHCISILKGCFQSLQGLPLGLTSVETMKRITHTVYRCLCGSLSSAAKR
ncbi:uncharacterized protein VP01_4644g1 [Puccinia sorghi]|uniref:Uncharacterized protein n=1 Tax=Puccinia sorghi TaxID=27349 RepID=A0A0L6UNB0_9BASI|nr:uncharacterized protein VP01_4644g1 [Puccinia sorghi]